MQTSSYPPLLIKTQLIIMARSNTKSSCSSLTDSVIFTAGGFVALLLLFFILFSFLSSNSVPNFYSIFSSYDSGTDRETFSNYDPFDHTFYDDPTFGYTIDNPVSNWDEKRRQWLMLHPSFSGGVERVLMVSGSQPMPCPSSDGDHILLRSLKNKGDYCRLHGMELFYNTALLNPAMPSYWAKIPVIRAAMMAHPEAEWIWWVDSDAIITDMDFSLPLAPYRDHNFVVNGWPELIYKAKSWVSLNAGVFLIRNCQWSLDFMDDWASMGPQSPDYEKWGKILTSTFKDKMFPISDDQSALAYLILTGKGGWKNRIYLEHDYYFQGYWLEIVDRLDNISARYNEMERQGPAVLRHRHAERVFISHAKERNAQLRRVKGAINGSRGWRRPFITHFTGCQPCSGDRNKAYSGDKCTKGMYTALNFADDQVLRMYGFRHAGSVSSDVRLLPFDYPRN